MTAVGDRQMTRKDRGGIAEDEVVVPVEDRLLFRREMFKTEETGTLPDGFRIELRAGADDPPRIELEFHPPAVAANLPDPGRFQGGVALGETGPGLLLPFEKSGSQVDEGS